MKKKNKAAKGKGKGKGKKRNAKAKAKAKAKAEATPSDESGQMSKKQRVNDDEAGVATAQESDSPKELPPPPSTGATAS